MKHHPPIHPSTHPPVHLFIHTSTHPFHHSKKGNHTKSSLPTSKTPIFCDHLVNHIVTFSHLLKSPDIKFSKSPFYVNKKEVLIENSPGKISDFLPCDHHQTRVFDRCLILFALQAPATNTSRFTTQRFTFWRSKIWEKTSRCLLSPVSHESSFEFEDVRGFLIWDISFFCCFDWFICN